MAFPSQRHQIIVLIQQLARNLSQRCHASKCLLIIGSLVRAQQAEPITRPSRLGITSRLGIFLAFGYIRSYFRTNPDSRKGT